ncbi:MAG: hypothetical protein ABIS03_12525, partial [Gemmatimonadaceae bacterium]
LTMKFVSLIILATVLRAVTSIAHGQDRPTAADRIAEAKADTSYVEYDDEPVFSLPLGVGLRVPSYDRVNGVSIPFGPKIRIPGGVVELDPTVTYRSHLGKFDPALAAAVHIGASDELRIDGGIGTFTNDSWIRSALLNSLAALGVGTDSRNYYRSDRVNAVYEHTIPVGPWTTALSVGAQHEFDWSTGIHTAHTSAPWSFFGRKDSLKMRRINPAIQRGHLTSGLAGARIGYEMDAVKGTVDARVERAFDSPAVGQDDGKFTQLTLDAKVGFPTFGLQSFAFRGHAVAGNDAPPQRFAYLGGAGTLSTVDLLALGGDRLLFVEGEYRVPLSAPILPFVGSPVISLSYAAGAAGVGALPDLIQNIGIGVGLKIVKIDYHIDPNYRKTSYTHKSAFSLGFSLSL